MIMKPDKEKIKNDILLDKYTAKGFIDTCNAINDLQMQVFQGYQGETEKAEAWCEHCFCEFVLGYLDMVSHYLIDLHDLQEEHNNQNDK